MSDRQEELRAKLYACGFDVVRFAALEPPMTESALALRRWIEAGAHAGMGWLANSAEKRADPRLVQAGVRSVIVLGVSYASNRSRGAAVAWARYALHEDYHETIKSGLMAGARCLEAIYGVPGNGYRYYVDTGPLLERAWAERAGVGFVGKNSMLISRTHGNWLLLAGILTTLEFQPDPQLSPQTPSQQRLGLHCGNCTRCISACPTSAITASGFVDARLCVSYHTIENRAVIPRELRAGIGNRIFGCDTCLEVCPWNRFARQARQTLLKARVELSALSLQEILRMDAEAFSSVFRGTAIKRTKLAGLLRNACVVAANTNSMHCLQDVVRLAEHASPVVRTHAVWAVYTMMGAERAGLQLADVRNRESDPMVLDEYCAWSGG